MTIVHCPRCGCINNEKGICTKQEIHMGDVIVPFSEKESLSCWEHENKKDT